MTITEIRARSMNEKSYSLGKNLLKIRKGYGLAVHRYIKSSPVIVLSERNSLKTYTAQRGIRDLSCTIELNGCKLCPPPHNCFECER